MGLGQVEDYLLSSGWAPPGTTCTPHWGHVVVVQRPSGLSLLLRLPLRSAGGLHRICAFGAHSIEAMRVSQMAAFLLAHRLLLRFHSELREVLAP